MLEVRERFGPEATLVTLIPDCGRGYLSKLYDDNWLIEHGFLERGTPADDRRGARASRATGPDVPELVTVQSHQKVGDAIDLMQRYGISQLPVVRREEVDSLADLVGSIRERGLFDRVFRRPGVARRGGRGRHGAAAPDGRDHRVRRRLCSPTCRRESRGRGRPRRQPVGVLSRADLLEYLAHGRDGTGA